MLLSFAQFEREVTSERIRDKIAASKQRGLWVGGMVPLGYASREKKLVVVEEEAERVRLIFQLYRELGSLGRLLSELRRQEIITKVRQLSTGRTIGGIPFTRGPLAYLLRNRFYFGEVVYRGKVCPGEHPAIVERELFEAVQAQLAHQHSGFVAKRTGSQALLLGKLFDDGGNRMSPSHASKRGVRYRYYVSAALAQARPEAAGSVKRVAAAEVEGQILRALREHHPDLGSLEDRELIERSVERIVLGPMAIEVTLHELANGAGTITIPWSRAATRRQREILLPDNSSLDHRPIRAETPATLVRSIALGRR